MRLRRFLTGSCVLILALFFGVVGVSASGGAACHFTYTIDGGGTTHIVGGCSSVPTIQYYVIAGDGADYAGSSHSAILYAANGGPSILGAGWSGTWSMSGSSVTTDIAHVPPNQSQRDADAASAAAFQSASVISITDYHAGSGWTTIGSGTYGASAPSGGGGGGGRDYGAMFAGVLPELAAGVGAAVVVGVTVFALRFGVLRGMGVVRELSGSGWTSHGESWEPDTGD